MFTCYSIESIHYFFLPALSHALSQAHILQYCRDGGYNTLSFFESRNISVVQFNSTDLRHQRNTLNIQPHPLTCIRGFSVQIIQMNENPSLKFLLSNFSLKYTETSKK